jgi:transcriptional regulator with XRE-family HTH domain
MPKQAFSYLALMKEPGKTKFEIAITDKVRELRLQKGFSQEYIAEVLGFSIGFIGQIETPSHPSKYNLNHLNRLAKEMGCSPRDFIPEEFIEEENWTED